MRCIPVHVLARTARSCRSVVTSVELTSIFRRWCSRAVSPPNRASLLLVVRSIGGRVCRTDGPEGVGGMIAIPPPVRGRVDQMLVSCIARLFLRA